MHSKSSQNHVLANPTCCPSDMLEICAIIKAGHWISKHKYFPNQFAHIRKSLINWATSNRQCAQGNWAPYPLSQVEVAGIGSLAAHASLPSFDQSLERL